MASFGLHGIEIGDGVLACCEDIPINTGSTGEGVVAAFALVIIVSMAVLLLSAESAPNSISADGLSAYLRKCDNG